MLLEVLRGSGWQDLTFGLLEGWWRFADPYRANHALAPPPVWRRALADTGFEEVTIMGAGERSGDGPLGSGVIVAKGPQQMASSQGIWVLTTDRGGVGRWLAIQLAERRQTVVLTGQDTVSAEATTASRPRVTTRVVQEDRRDSWKSLFEELSKHDQLMGIVHIAALDGHRPGATTEELAEDTTRVGAGALAMMQGLRDAGAGGVVRYAGGAGARAGAHGRTCRSDAVGIRQGHDP